jgi:hypothetical protein
VTARKISTCSFTTDVSSYRGTKSYQEDLKELVKLDAGYSGIYSFAFSFSRSYEHIQNTTSVQKSTLTHATAECQSYELILDKFAIPELTDDFVYGAIKSHKKKNWNDFIEEFGTDYVHELTMGGRATQ